MANPGHRLTDAGLPAAEDGQRRASGPQRRRQSRTSRTRQGYAESSSMAAAAAAAATTSFAQFSGEGGRYESASSRTSSLSSQQSFGGKSSAADDDLTGIAYTRTGRISKAKKGQRVHECDRCDKRYTRAEHLRRHQRKHGEPLECPSCDYICYRDDVLQQHVQRQHEEHSVHTSPIPASSMAQTDSAPAFAPTIQPASSCIPPSGIYQSHIVPFAPQPQPPYPSIYTMKRRSNGIMRDEANRGIETVTISRIVPPSNNIQGYSTPPPAWLPPQNFQAQPLMSQAPVPVPAPVPAPVPTLQPYSQPSYYNIGDFQQTPYSTSDQLVPQDARAAHWTSTPPIPPLSQSSVPVQVPVPAATLPWDTWAMLPTAPPYNDASTQAGYYGGAT